MSEPGREELERQLAGCFEQGTRVRVTGAASVGAQRQTLFLDLVREAETSRAVAQIASQVIAAADTRSEEALLRAARNAGVRVPRLLAVDHELGAIVSERVDGESIPRRILRLVEAEPALGDRLARECGEQLALIHRIPVDPLALEDDFADPDDYADEMERLLETLSTPHPTFRLGINWLRRRPLRATSSPALVHGDFRLGNFLADARGLAAVLDWELAHRGDPMEDLAWLCLRCWRFGNDDRTVGGFGPLSALREGYEKAGGRWRQQAFDWWTVARTLWWGLGLARQAEAFLDGQTNSIVLAASGRRVVELEYDLLTLIG